MPDYDPVLLEIMKSLLTAVAEEMGAALGRTAFSPNIKERRDFSCAVFDPAGQMVAQAAHIPVHLGAMPLSVAAALARFPQLGDGDIVVLNDPYSGGSHLPDITMVSPVYGASGAVDLSVLASWRMKVKRSTLSGGLHPERSTVVRSRRTQPVVEACPERSRRGRAAVPVARPHPSTTQRVLRLRTAALRTMRCSAQDAPRPVLIGYVASRAHHADVGGISPGSMPLARDLFQEGLIIPPVLLRRAGQIDEGVLDLITRNSRTPAEREGDLAAQIAAQHVGAARLRELAGRYGHETQQAYMAHLQDYAERMVRDLVRAMPPGRFSYRDVMDDDGAGTEDVPIAVAVERDGDELLVDFTGTAPEVAGGINAVRSVTLSAVFYVVRCLLADDDVPTNAGIFRPVRVILPEGALVNARFPRAVAAGNVETSQRIVDVLLGAFGAALPDLAPAASQGTMNNITIGGTDPRTGGPFAYYETIAGGMGAAASAAGLSGVHVHMTNTLNTPAEALEYAYPLRVTRYALRRGSGGAGRWRGGDGVIREIELLADAQVTILSERRRHAPWGAAGGGAGAMGANAHLVGAGLAPAQGDRKGAPLPLPGKLTFHARAGDRVRIETPGGGGCGQADEIGVAGI